ncbi:hypothetical protein Zmor_027828 [Zophobas morio]|uniref:Uncharacterized protein n=1 Tax=Zophobas morio TaxID=2755281 RepID=A0AA38M2U4_9CUCU|nr:hypothetical protein Zmor_027828 [Zophobas morio]
MRQNYPPFVPDPPLFFDPQLLGFIVIASFPHNQSPNRPSFSTVQTSSVLRKPALNYPSHTKERPSRRPCVRTSSSSLLMTATIKFVIPAAGHRFGEFSHCDGRGPNLFRSVVVSRRN